MHLNRKKSEVGLTGPIYEDIDTIGSGPSETGSEKLVSSVSDQFFFSFEIPFLTSRARTFLFFCFFFQIVSGDRLSPHVV